ncbi:MAG: hypothetical protein KGL37_01575 [Acidobacteriota bacterium]|nr:hypothetical protein [Acidobacteriota bacterium]
MNRYFLIRRLMGPSILLLIGVVALLHQAHLVHWSLLIPLLLILIGVLKLAERAALGSEGGYPPYPGAPYSGVAGTTAPSGAPPSQGQTATPIVPEDSQTFGKESDGGQS